MITRLLKPKSAATPTLQDADVQTLSDDPDTGPATPAAPTHDHITKERRRFPRPLPVPEVVEDNSDAAWEEFHKISDSNWAALAGMVPQVPSK